MDPGVPVFGTKGASVHVQEVVRELRGRGHEVSVYTTRAGSRVPADLEDLRVVEVPLGPHPGTAAREAAQARASRELAARAEADHPDLVYERYSLFSRALSQVTATTGAASVLEVNSPLVDEQRTHRGLCDAEGALEALRAQVGAAGLTLCVSGPVEAWVRGRCPTGRVRTLPNGVNTVRITPRPEDPDQVVVTFVGTLKPWHGVEDLLRAAALAREPWSLRVVGDGPQGPALRSQAREDGLEVDFRGAVAPEQVPDHLAGSAVAVAPYPEPTTGQGHYFSPLKVYEYMAAGLPVVASAVGQLPGALEGCGLLVPPSDPQALADALDALASDPRRRRELGQRARQEAVEHHSWSRVVTRALELAGVDSA
ncbi:glycosyltransferase family 4 protein [uncultured Actinomyces sp.]|uniref:glycosyltransferase family 4 protein n=1 Tax=uncultured Actinomyces sp. TaxID=249061 RepID=UPI00345DFE4D